MEQEVLVLASVLAPIVVALVEAIKRAFMPSDRVMPLVAVVVGLIVASVGYPFTDMELVLRLWSGVLAGLSAVGLFELGKQAKKPEEKT